MPASEKSRVKVWTERLRASGKMYEKWSDRFETHRLEKYYLGEQWRGMTEDEARKRYVINLVFSSIEVNKPSLIFYNPQVRVQSRPARADDLGSTSDLRARLSQDTIQTFIDDPDVDFHLETSLALHEAHFRFGVIEVGYSADYIDNPNAGKPVLKEKSTEEGIPGSGAGGDDANQEPVRDSDGNEVIQPDKLVNRENIFIKRIPASHFRCSLSNRNKTARNDWVGYFEWVYVEDVKRNPAYENTAGLKPTGVISTELQGTPEDADELHKHYGMIKLWRIWDIRRAVRHVIAEGHEKFLQEDVSFSFLPFAIIKFYEILDSFYPLPPVMEWLCPQDEVNETRDAQRAHRRRFYRRYTYTEGAIEPTEIEKLETGGDGVYAKSNKPDPIQPVPDAPLSADNWTHLDRSMQDFQIVSGVGGEQRGVAESETATQASIIDVRSRLRETSARTKVANWLAEISRLILLTVREKMALPFWIQINTDPAAKEKGSPDAEKVAKTWQEISSEDLGSIDLDVFIDLASMSPVTEDIQRNSWNQVLALLTNPTLVQIMAQSEVLLRKTLQLYGIRTENEIAEIQRVCQQVTASMAAQASADAAAKAKLPGTSADLSAAAASQLTGGTGGPGPEGAGSVPGPPGMRDMTALLTSVGRQM